MASLRDIRRRIASVQNTRKITKAMEMVAAAKLRRAQQRIVALRPYAIDMVEMMMDLAAYAEGTGGFDLLRTHAEERTAALVVPVGRFVGRLCLRVGLLPNCQHAFGGFRAKLVKEAG